MGAVFVTFVVGGVDGAGVGVGFVGCGGDGKVGGGVGAGNGAGDVPCPAGGYLIIGIIKYKLVKELDLNYHVRN
jgi:hypothetical protein